MHKTPLVKILQIFLTGCYARNIPLRVVCMVMPEIIRHGGETIPFIPLTSGLDGLQRGVYHVEIGAYVSNVSNLSYTHCFPPPDFPRAF